MSTFVLMRILESAPHRYDAGIRLLTLGKLDAAYDRLCECVEKGQDVLDIGCGTGALTIRAARKGSRVQGIDVNPEMLAAARARIAEAGFLRSVSLREMGVAELDAEAPESFDVVMSGLCFSELSVDELDFTLSHVNRILKPEGTLLLADEVRPSSPFARLLLGLLRMPLVAITYLLSGQTTRAITNLPERITRAGLTLETTRTTLLGSLMEIVARK